MQFVAVRDFRVDSAKIWKMLDKEHEVIVTSHGKPIAMLTPLSSDNWESRMDAQWMAKGAVALQKLREQAQGKGLGHLSMKSIDEEIRRVRARKR